MLTQNRDPDNYDFSEILKYSPKQVAKASGVFSKTGYNSTKASKDKMAESTNSKKKKYGSIIMQPDRSSPVNNRSVGNDPNPQTFDDVRITEEDEFMMRTAEELNQEQRASPSALIQAY